MMKPILLLVAAWLALPNQIPAQSVAVSLPDTVTQQAEIDLPIRIGELSGLNVVAFNLVVSFDSTLLVIDSLTTESFLAEGLILTPNFSNKDRVIVAGASATFLAGRGVLLELHARFIGTGQTELRFEKFVFNEGSPQAELVHGRLSNAGRTDAEKGGAFPLAFALSPNYPNPFATATTVRFDLPVSAPVTFRLYDLLGRLVYASEPVSIAAGPDREWPLSAASFGAGTYVLRLQADLPSGLRFADRPITIVR
jgi:hypothetical protein